MTADYLKNARKSGLTADSPFTEAELIETRPQVKEAWESLMEVRNKIFLAKQEALGEVDTKFAEELEEAESTYAMMLSLSR